MRHGCRPVLGLGYGDASYVTYFKHERRTQRREDGVDVHVPLNENLNTTTHPTHPPTTASTHLRRVGVDVNHDIVGTIAGHCQLAGQDR